MHLAWIALGGGLGALLRHGAFELVRGWLGARWPFGTLLVNLAGCLALGWLAAGWERASEPAASLHAQAFLAVGLLGSFTTFSTFGVEAVALWREGRGGAALGYVLASVLLGLGAALLGGALARA